MNSALERVERDFVQDQLKDLSINLALVLACVSQLTKSSQRVSTGDLYSYHRDTIKEGPHIRRLSERRVLEIVSELETLGLISTWNVSRGRRGYGREIKMNVNPVSVLEFYAEGVKRDARARVYSH